MPTDAVTAAPANPPTPAAIGVKTFLFSATNSMASRVPSIPCTAASPNLEKSVFAAKSESAGNNLSSIGSSTSISIFRFIPSTAEPKSSYFTLFSSSMVPLVSSKVFPTLVKDSINFIFPSSPMVPKAKAALLSLSCWFSVFLISSTMASMTCFWVAPPCCHCLNKSSTPFPQLPVPSSNSPVFWFIESMEPSNVPSARRLVTSLIASFTLSRL